MNKPIALALACLLPVLITSNTALSEEQAPEIEWIRQFGTSHTNDTVNSVAVGPQSEIYVVGETMGTFPGQTSAGYYDAYVRKYDAEGNEIWTRQFGTPSKNRWGTPSKELTYDVAVGPQGEVYVAGNTEGTLPGQTYAGGYIDAYVRKYDPDGNEIWTRQFGTPSSDSVNGVAVGSRGELYVAGFTGGVLPGQTSVGYGDTYVRKYDAEGNEIWTRQFGTPGSDSAYSIAVGTQGDIYVAGSTDGAFPGHTSAGDKDVFVRKYDENGNEIWTRQFGTPMWDSVWGVAVGPQGEVYVAGRTSGALPGQTYAGGLEDGYVRKYDENGNEIWTRQFGTSLYDGAEDVATGPQGEVYVAGYTEGLLGQSSAGDVDVLVRKYDPDGNEIWTHQFGTPLYDEALSVAIGAQGEVYVTGDTEGTLPGQTSAGGDDVYVAKFAAPNPPASTDVTASGIPPPEVPDWIPPGKREDQVPPGEREDLVSPGQQEDWVPPGKQEDRVPLGKREDWVPPGKREDRVPLGKREDWVPPGKRQAKK